MHIDDIKNRMNIQKSDDWWESLGQVIVNNNKQEFIESLEKYLKDL